MKIATKVYILIALLTLIQLPGHAQSDKNMKQNSIEIPLKSGKNPIVHFETLDIDPVNLSIQSKPLDNGAPTIQLELNVVGDNREYATFLWYYDDNKKTNYPKAYENHVFSLEVCDDEVKLVVEKSTFGKAFFIDLGQAVVINNIIVRFEQSMGEWSEDLEGNRIDAFNIYDILLSAENERKTVSFMSLDKYEGNELSMEWKDYEILVLDDLDKTLKLMVFKRSSEKN